MKAVILALSVNILLMGCTTIRNKPILLSSQLQNANNDSINPALSVPQKGYHPYFGIELGNLKLNEKEYKVDYIGINTGIVYQSSLETINHVKYFASINTTCELSLHKMNPNKDSIQTMKEQNTEIPESYITSIDSELNLHGGLLIQFNGMLMAIYAISILQYEDGDYYEFRKKVDGNGNYYNISTNKVAYGGGIGYDFSFGKISKYDFGLFIEMRGIKEATQTYADSDVEYDDYMLFPSTGSYVVKTKNGGTTMTIGNVRCGCYMDIKNNRISMNLSPYNIGCSYIYRW